VGVGVGLTGAEGIGETPPPAPPHALSPKAMTSAHALVASSRFPIVLSAQAVEKSRLPIVCYGLRFLSICLKAGNR
jgi:hypothetical protein